MDQRPVVGGRRASGRRRVRGQRGFFRGARRSGGSGRGSATRPDAALADELGWDAAVARLIRAGHRLGDVTAYTLTQAQAFLDVDGQIERQQLAQLLGIHAVAAQGEKRGIEQLQRDLLKD
ncbi:hypothetical protein LHGZ1_2940 [Laribacter hongkongensis]|uniref:Uncharacterized protein n=1 Tax=Laribacter hongkongensis TaxID=168471 RepID=A0A248LMR5_9NEIS|nr:hypothetical protein LHGZ1_2940 [Laribacter hongkongensis]